MTSHDTDARYSDVDSRARVAVLYLPLLGIVMDTIPQLHQYLPDTHDRWQNIGLLEDYQGPHTTLTSSTISSEVAYAIAGSRMYNFSPEPTKNKSGLSSENTRHLLSFFAWILKNLERTVLYRWALGQTPLRIHQMLQVLNVCIPSFEYKGQKRQPVRRQNTHSFRKTPDMKERLEECIRGTGSARNDLINRRKDRNTSEKLRWRKDQMPYR